MENTDIENLLIKYNMKPHQENGSFSECHYPFEGEGRAASGSTYFHVPANESTLFHRIDCDEYWCFNAGSALEIWIVDINGRLEVKKFGIGDDADPLMYFPKGVIFGSRSLSRQGDGTFFTCITVPRFSYDGFELIGKDDLLKLCPEAESFFSTN